MLKLGTVTGGEADLRQRVFKTGLLGDLRQLAVVVDGPTGALLDLADDQSSADVRHPVGKFYR